MGSSSEGSSSGSLPFDEENEGESARSGSSMEVVNVFPNAVWSNICDHLPAVHVMRLVRMCKQISRIKGLPLNWCDNSQYRTGDYVTMPVCQTKTSRTKRYSWRGVRVLEIDDADLKQIASAWPKLQTLDTAFANMSTLDDLAPLATSLRKLILKNASRLGNVRVLQSFVRLQVLHISWSAELEEVGLACLVGLTEVNLYQCQSLRRLMTLPASLRHLSIGCPAGLDDISAVAECPRLQTCQFTWCETLEDIRCLAACQELTCCDLAHCSSLADLRPLGTLQRLTDLNLSHCKDVVDIAPLGACSVLRDLKLVGCSKIRNIHPLGGCLDLQKLDISFCDVAKESMRHAATHVPHIVGGIAVHTPTGGAGRRESNMMMAMMASVSAGAQ